MKRVRIYKDKPCMECGGSTHRMQDGGDFTPHLMYDEMGNAYEANNYNDHLAYTNQGFFNEDVLNQMFPKIKKQYGGDIALQNESTDSVIQNRNNMFKDRIANNTMRIMAQKEMANFENQMQPMMQPNYFQPGGDVTSYSSYVGNPMLNQFIDKEQQKKALDNNIMSNMFNTIADTDFSKQWVAKSKFLDNPLGNQMKQQYKDMNKLYKNPLYAYQQMMSNIPQMEYGGNNPIPKMQWAGGFNPGSSIFNTQSPIMQTNYAGMANTKKTPAMTNKHWDAKNKRQSYTDEYGRKIVKGFDDKGNVLWTRVDGTVTQRSDAWQNRNKKGSTQGTTQDAAAQAQASKNTGTSTTATTNTGTGTNTGSTVTQGNVNPNAPTTSNTTTSNTNDGNTNQNNTNQGNTPQFGTVFPNVGFGRKGSLPFMYDPANTHLSEITTRRALMPGNRIKKISFTHGMPVQNSMMFNQQGSQSSMVDNQDFNNRSFRNKAADAFLQIPGLRGLGAKMLDHGNAPMPSNEYTSNTSNRFQLPLKPTVPFTTSTPQNLIPLTGIPQNVIAQNTQQVNTPQNVVPQNVPQQTVVSQNTVPQTTVPQTTQQQVVPQKQTSSKSNTSVKPKTTKTSNNTQRQTSNTGTKQNSSAFYQTKIDEMYKKGPYNEEVQKYIDLKNKAEAAEIAQAKKDKWNAAKKAKLAEEQRKDKAAQYNQSSHYNVKERFGGDINYFQEGGPTDTMMYPSEDFQYNNNPFYNYAEFMYPQETYEQDINNEEMYDEEMYDENMITPFHNIGVDYASLVMPYEEYPSEEVMQYGGIFSNNRAGRKNKFKNISINMYGYPPNEEMTDDFNSYTPGYGGGAYPSEDGNYGNFVRNISPSSNTEGFARFSDGTFTSEGYTPPPSYQEGGEYELTDEEIEAIIQNGGEVEFI